MNKISYVYSTIRLLYDLLSDLTTAEVALSEAFIAKEREYQGQLIEIKSQMEGLKRINPNFMEDAHQTLELSKRLYPNYVRANYQEKAKLLQLIASNYTLQGVNPIPTYKKPFGFIAEGLLRPKWLPESYSETTLFRSGIFNFSL